MLSNFYAILLCNKYTNYFILLFWMPCFIWDTFKKIYALLFFCFITSILVFVNIYFVYRKTKPIKNIKSNILSKQLLKNPPHRNQYGGAGRKGSHKHPASGTFHLLLLQVLVYRGAERGSPDIQQPSLPTTC